MSKKLSVIFLSIVLAIVVAACGKTGTGTNTASENTNTHGAQAPKENEELTIKHQLGETKVKKNPEKVVVFDFGVLDSLDKMGVNVTGVPQANIPPYLEKYKDAKYKNVGSLTEPDFEKINAIGPDLIIISGRQSKAYEELSKIGPTIFMGVDNAKYMESFKQNVTTLGDIFDKASVVKDELAKVEETVKTVNQKATASGKNALIILVNGGKISAYGAGSRFGIIHDVLGFAPVDKNIEVSTHGQSISVEYVVEKDPDYLFVIDRDAALGNGAAAKQVVENELVKNNKAFKNGNIVYLDSNYWYLSGGGLISVAEMVKEVEAGLK